VADSAVKLNTPVVLMIFKRPEHTARVFAEIAKAKPRKLFIVADGPRPERSGEAELAAATRAVVERVDWDCEVYHNYSDVNLGCGRRVSSGISWAFEQVQEAIILEDDCLPHPTFFRFCEELLQRYQNDERVMMISGNNFELQWKADQQSYHFSRFPATWGWATWRRAWQHYDFLLSNYRDAENQQKVCTFLENPQWCKRMYSLFEQTRTGKIDTWDYQWGYSCFKQQGYTVVPAKNLVSNIGFGEGATHTDNSSNRFANMPAFPMNFPLRVPAAVEADTNYDRATFIRWRQHPLVKRLYWSSRHRVKKLLKAIS
jgi:hypothetical protein